jgi:Zn-dependent protease
LSIDFGAVFFAYLVLLFSLTVHETAHAWMSDRLGDSTARLLGRVSLNPAVHVDVVGTIVFPLVALLTSIPVLGWAKPVPVNTLRLKNWRRDYMMIAAAGPLSNLMLAVIGAVIWQAVRGPLSGMPEDGVIAGPIVTVLGNAVVINVMLALFNLIPVPPLDGGTVLGGLLPERVASAYDRTVRPYGFILLYGLMFSGMLSAIMSPPANLLLGWLL